MKLQLSVLCLCALVLSASCQGETSEVLGPRGPRPAVLGFKTDKCTSQRDWPICTDEDWGRKCPSGCRVQGLLDQTDNYILKKIDNIRKLLDDGKKLHRSTDLESKTTYNYLRERLVSNAGNDNRYASLAEQLRQRIVELKIKIDRQLRVLEAVKAQIKAQFVAVQRLEVDIDIKLRSCKGSCASYAPFSVDKDSYIALEKQLERLDTLKVQNVETVSSLKVLKSRPLKDVEVASIYKAGITGSEREAQRKAYFTDIGQLQLSLEAEGSTADSAATVSKVTSVCESVRSLKPHTPYTYRRRFGQCPANTQPMCADEDEGVKCPSGCRLQSLVNEADGDVYQRLSRVCDESNRCRSASASTISETIQFYEAQRRRIVKTHMEELRRAEVAQTLHRNLTLLWKKTSELSRELQQNHKHVQDQIDETHKLEVDIDIKLRACKGSCKQTFDHVPDHETFKSMQDEMTGFDFQSTQQKIFTLDKNLRLQPVDRPEVSLAYRRLPFIHSKLLTKFEDIELNQVVVDEL